MGLSGASISGSKFGVRRLVDAISRDFFLEDAEAHYLSLLSYEDEELTAEAWPDQGIGEPIRGFDTVSESILRLAADEG
jgi:hypothetical protein